MSLGGAKSTRVLGARFRGAFHVTPKAKRAPFHFQKTLFEKKNATLATIFLLKFVNFGNLLLNGQKIVTTISNFIIHSAIQEKLLDEERHFFKEKFWRNV